MEAAAKSLLWFLVYHVTRKMHTEYQDGGQQVGSRRGVRSTFFSFYWIWKIKIL